MKIESIKIINENRGNCTFEQIGKKGEIYLYKFTYSSEKETVPSAVTVKWRIPSVGIFSTWNPVTRFNRALRTVNTAGIIGPSRISDGAPVQTLIDRNGKNRITFAVSDAVTPMELNTQIHEEGMEMDCMVKFFSMPVRKMRKYEALVRIDFSDIPYYEALKNAGDWWRNDCGITDAYVPEFAKDVLYSTWYSYHHDFTDEEIINQCRKAHDLGMNNVILDAGWNMTADKQRRYGDYEVNNPNIRNMTAMVDEIHKIGMKFMLWFSVPFISKDAKLWERFGEFILNDKETAPWFCLDPRYKEVRDYTVSVYERAIKDWHLDGLKLDFINSFNLSEYSMKKDDRRDFESLEDAVAQLVEDIALRVKAIKPDILIEFRQPYMGPKTCGTANMMRVNDCPNDALFNRVGSIDLRLLLGKTAVHSDMIGWNRNDTPEGCARQLIAVLFSVPQISVKLEEQNESQLKTLKFYIDFYTENRAALLDGKIMAFNPEANYSVVVGEKDNNAVAVCYSKNYVKTAKRYEKLSVINGTEEEIIILNNEAEKYDAEITVYDCMGNILREENANIKTGLNFFEIPPCGLVKIR